MNTEWKILKIRSRTYMYPIKLIFTEHLHTQFTTPHLRDPNTYPIMCTWMCKKGYNSSSKFSFRGTVFWDPKWATCTHILSVVFLGKVGAPRMAITSSTRTAPTIKWGNGISFFCLLLTWFDFDYSYLYFVCIYKNWFHYFDIVKVIYSICPKMFVHFGSACYFSIDYVLQSIIF